MFRRAAHRFDAAPLVFGIFLFAAFGWGLPPTAQAKTACTLIYDLEHETSTYQAGTHCDQPFSPASTFKLALGLIGFEESILTAPSTPAIPYDKSLEAPFQSWKQTITPQKWLQFSVVWYSQWLTRQLGAPKFQAYIDQFNYGNRDLSGTPGQNDGLTRAWLSNSLKITPIQQAQFLRQLRKRTFPMAPHVYERLFATAQEFQANGDLLLWGKTGNAWATDDSFNRHKEQHGWFVGWLEHQGAQYVFVHLIIDPDPKNGFASAKAQAELLQSIKKWLPQTN